MVVLFVAWARVVKKREVFCLSLYPPHRRALSFWDLSHFLKSSPQTFRHPRKPSVIPAILPSSPQSFRHPRASGDLVTVAVGFDSDRSRTESTLPATRKNPPCSCGARDARNALETDKRFKLGKPQFGGALSFWDLSHFLKSSPQTFRHPRKPSVIPAILPSSPQSFRHPRASGDLVTVAVGFDSDRSRTESTLPATRKNPPCSCGARDARNALETDKRFKLGKPQFGGALSFWDLSHFLKSSPQSFRHPRDPSVIPAQAGILQWRRWNSVWTDRVACATLLATRENPPCTRAARSGEMASRQSHTESPT